MLVGWSYPVASMYRLVQNRYNWTGRYNDARETPWAR